MTLLSRLTRTAIALTRSALAPVRAALYVPVAHNSQSESERQAAQVARDTRLHALKLEGIDEHSRARAVRALEDIDAALRQLAACLDPSGMPGAPGEDAEARESRKFNTLTVGAREAGVL